MTKYLFVFIFLCISYSAKSQWTYTYGTSYMLSSKIKNYFKYSDYFSGTNYYMSITYADYNYGGYVYPKYHFKESSWSTTSTSLGVPFTGAYRLAVGPGYRYRSYMLDLPITFDINGGSYVPNTSYSKSFGYFFGVGLSYTKSSSTSTDGIMNIVDFDENIPEGEIPTDAKVYDLDAENFDYEGPVFNSFGMLAHAGLTFTVKSTRWNRNYGFRGFGKLGISGPNYYGVSLTYTRQRRTD